MLNPNNLDADHFITLLIFFLKKFFLVQKYQVVFFKENLSDCCTLHVARDSFFRCFVRWVFFNLDVK